MPLTPPKLDERTAEELFAEALRRIQWSTPEWTDWNESDPGIALLQLFAWYTETMLYQLNHVPENSYTKFLELIGLSLEPAQPARCHVTFTAVPTAPEIPVVPQGWPLIGQPADGGEPLFFETDQGLSLIRPPLVDVQVYDGGSFQPVTAANDELDVLFHPFGHIPRANNALYFGFEESETLSTDVLFPDRMRFRVFLPEAYLAEPVQSQEQAALPPPAPLQLVWEYRPKPGARWQPLRVYLDETQAFMREGYIEVQGPPSIAATEEGRPAEEKHVPRYWIRCRIERVVSAVQGRPLVDAIRPNVTPVLNLRTVREEIVGESDALPDQDFTLDHKPVQRSSLQLVLERQGETLQEAKEWECVDDFYHSGPDSKHFTLDFTSGTVRFGNGEKGAIPPANALVIARQYRYGGGKAGNVGPESIKSVARALSGVDRVINERRAVGGSDEQALEELKQWAPQYLRRRNQAITAEDYRTFTEEIGGVAKAAAIPLAHPDYPDAEAPGAVTVVIVPESEDRAPQPSPDLLREVARRLNEVRLLTSEVYVKRPSYRAVRVEAKVQVEAHAAFNQVRQAVVAAINHYLDPLGRWIDQPTDPSQILRTGSAEGAEKGWPFGRDFYPTNLYPVIKGAHDDVVTVEHLALFVSDLPHPIFEQVELKPDQLLHGVAGHTINIEPARDF